MTRIDTDVLISGAGIAGMTLAALLARQGLGVTICDPAPPPRSSEADGSDLRSTAYLAPSRALLEEAGFWPALAPHATPLASLRVMDSTGWPPRQTATRTFQPGDLELESFGWNVPNWRARMILTEILEADPRVDLRLGTGFAGLLARDAEARVRLSDGSMVRARLAVGADGRASPVREATGIGVRVRRYGQKALAFATSHDEPHRDISTEIYNSGGAFTTVPLPDHAGQSASAIVWMNDGRRSAELERLDRDAFDEQLTLRSLAMLGRMRAISPIRVWPIVTQTATALTSKRCALVAEAAHVLPPIGAQGLNTSFADISALAAAILGRDPGAPETLAAYEGARRRDVAARAAVIDVFNRVCQADGSVSQAVRQAGLKTLYDIAPLRRQLMRAGMGAPR